MLNIFFRMIDGTQFIILRELEFKNSEKNLFFKRKIIE